MISRADDESSKSLTAVTLLCVCNFPSDTGYAWDFVERLYAEVANTLAHRNARTLVCYPKLHGNPATLAGSVAQPVEFGFGFATARQALQTFRFLRSHRVRALYLTDRPACSLFYSIVRLAGVRHIVVHDHTSGDRTAPRGLKRLIKWLFVRTPSVSANVVIAVSNYVAERDIMTLSVRPNRIIRVWNGIRLSPATQPTGLLRKLANVGADRTLVVCSCRANPVKGVEHLLRAFEKAYERVASGTTRPVLIYIGDGPQLSELERIRDRLDSSNDIIFLGYQPNASQLLTEADICVVPSVWQDAFPLSVLEPMAQGKPVIATAVGGIPEMIEHGVTGLLIPPADDIALSSAISQLLTDPGLARRLGAAARKRVSERFTPELQLRIVTEIVGRGFSSQTRESTTAR